MLLSQFRSTCRRSTSVSDLLAYATFRRFPVLSTLDNIAPSPVGLASTVSKVDCFGSQKCIIQSFCISCLMLSKALWCSARHSYLQLPVMSCLSGAVSVEKSGTIIRKAQETTKLLSILRCRGPVDGVHLSWVSFDAVGCQKKTIEPQLSLLK